MWSDNKGGSTVSHKMTMTSGSSSRAEKTLRQSLLSSSSGSGDELQAREGTPRQQSSFTARETPRQQSNFYRKGHLNDGPAVHRNNLAEQVRDYTHLLTKLVELFQEKDVFKVLGNYGKDVLRFWLSSEDILREVERCMGDTSFFVYWREVDRRVPR